MAGSAVKRKTSKANGVAAPRKQLDPKSRDLVVLFAIRLREAIETSGMTHSAFADAVTASGAKTSAELVKKWLGAERFPRPNHLAAIGYALGKDYRELLPPPPPKPTRKKS